MKLLVIEASAHKVKCCIRENEYFLVLNITSTVPLNLNRDLFLVLDDFTLREW